MTRSILCYTDGSRIKGDRGGWAYIIFTDIGSATLARCYSGAEQKTTSSFMELTAMRNALHDPLLERKNVVIRTDSSYVCKGINEWMEQWKRNGWVKPKYPEVWQEIYTRCQFLRSIGNLTVEWVKGHSTDAHNKMVDKLATDASKSLPLNGLCA